MPFLSSNLPSKIFYASVGSEILRIVRTTTELDDIKIRVETLLIRMKKQGSEKKRIITLMNKLYGRHAEVFSKFADTSDNFIKLFSF